MLKELHRLGKLIYGHTGQLRRSEVVIWVPASGPNDFILFLLSRSSLSSLPLGSLRAKLAA